MDKKNILMGLVAATVVSTASASTTDSFHPTEKQSQEQIVSNLISDLNIVMNHPECTIKGSKK